MSIVDICVIDNSRDDIVTWIASALTRDDIGIKSVADMVTRVVAICSNGDKIRELKIVGHGNYDGMWIGEDWVDSGSISWHSANLPLLRRRFDSSGFVTLGGCQVGQNQLLLVKMSALLGVPVRAFTAMQRPLVPGNQGSETKCYYLNCTHGKKSGFDYLDND